MARVLIVLIVMRTVNVVLLMRIGRMVTTLLVIKERRMVNVVLLMRIGRMVTTLLVVRTRRVLATPSSRRSKIFE